MTSQSQYNCKHLRGIVYDTRGYWLAMYVFNYYEITNCMRNITCCRICGRQNWLDYDEYKRQEKSIEGRKV